MTEFICGLLIGSLIAVVFISVLNVAKDKKVEGNDEDNRDE